MILAFFLQLGFGVTLRHNFYDKMRKTNSLIRILWSRYDFDFYVHLPSTIHFI